MIERHLDDEIDRAVRDLMAVDTDSAFRARVPERVDHARHRRSTPIRLVLAGGAAAVVIFAAVMMWTGDSRSVPQRAENCVPAVAPRVTAHAPPTTPQTAHGGTTSVIERVGAPPRLATHRVRSTPQIAPRMVAATVAPLETTVQIEPLQAIDPITVAPLDMPRIAAQEIVVAPLEPIVEVHIAPLSPRMERD